MKVFFCLCLFSSIASFSQIKIQTNDIRNFWEAFDGLSTTKDSARTLQRLYFDRASSEFKNFIRLKNITPRDFVEAIKKNPTRWRAMRSNSELILTRMPEMQEAFKQFSLIYPSFEPPTVCFAFSCFRGGTASKNLALIGLEAALGSASQNNLLSILMHEVVHTQQCNGLSYLISKYLGPQLLVRSIREGAADFIGTMVSKENFNQSQHEYGERHEKELWREFKSEMMHDEIKNWLYNSDSKTRPRDLGYFMGFKICEAYFNGSTDRARAIKRIVRVRNYKKLLRRSRYAERFER